MATSTPWGKSDYSKSHGRGVTFYGTPGHGGFKVAPTKARNMHPALLELGEHRKGGSWFEEDCAWAAVALSFPEMFEDEQVKAAHASAKNYYPDAYAKVFGPVDPAESHTLRRRAFEAENLDRYVVTSACGSWHERCPEGKVLVTARRGRDGAQCEALVGQADYDARGEFGYVLQG